MGSGALMNDLATNAHVKHDYAKDYLAQPGNMAAQSAGEAGHTNATHLVIEDDSHPRAGYFLRLSDIGEAEAGSGDAPPVVVNKAGNLESSEVAGRTFVLSGWSL